MNARLVTGLLVALLGAVGCAPLKVSRTVSLRGLPPLPDAKQVEMVERLEDVARPYQLVGKVTVWKAGSRLNKADTASRICDQAAQMGANGVIGLHSQARESLYSGLAVKWLASGETPRPVEKPVVISVLPVADDPKAPGRNEKIAQKLRGSGLDFVLEIKGYYVLPGWITDFDGGNGKAKNLDDATLASLGGGHAQSVLELAFVEPPKFNHYLLFASTHAKAKLTLLDKQTRTNTFEVTGSGGENTFPYFIVGGPIFSSLLPVFIIGPMRTEAGMMAAVNAVYQVSPICEDVPVKASH